jgi:hypothetical protein
MISIVQPTIVKLAEPYPLEKLLVSSAPKVWTSISEVSKKSNLVNTLKLSPGFGMAGHTFSPLEPTGLKAVLKTFAEIELPDVEGEIEGIHVFLSTAKILSEWTSPSQKTIFQKAIFYPEQLLPIIKRVLELVGTSHPALQNLKPGLDAVAFFIRTSKGVYTLICELKTEKAPKK